MKERIAKVLTMIMLICMLIPNVRVNATESTTQKPETTADAEDNTDEGSDASGRSILLDPGHGFPIEDFSGCDVLSGTKKSLQEAEATWHMAVELNKVLKERGYTVYCTRDLKDMNTFSSELTEIVDEDFKEEVDKKLEKAGIEKKNDAFYVDGKKKWTLKQVYYNAARGRLGKEIGCDVSFSFHFDASAGLTGPFAVGMHKSDGATEYGDDISLSVQAVKHFAKSAGWSVASGKEDGFWGTYTQFQFSSVPLIYIEMAGSKAQRKAITSDYDKYAKYLADAIDDLYDTGKITAGGNAVQATEKPAINNTTTGGISRFSEDHYIATERPLHEKEVKFADGSDLTSFEKTTLNIMKDDLTAPKESGIFTFLRALAVALGVVITVYTIFLYMIYWFDRVNSLMDFSLLKVVTFGKMETSKGYDLDYGEDSKVKVCEHSDILRSCIIGIAVGMFLTTGRIYYVAKWLYGVVQWLLVEVFG